MNARGCKGISLLKTDLLGWMPLSGDYPLPVEGMFLSRRDTAGGLENCLSGPLLSMTVQGVRKTKVGDVEYVYGEGECLVAWSGALHVNHATLACPERPHLALSLGLDTGLAFELKKQLSPSLDLPVDVSSRATTAGIIRADSKLLDALSRLLALYEYPEQIPHLAPMYIAEVHYRLLAGPDGGLSIPASSETLFKAWHSTEHAC